MTITYRGINHLALVTRDMDKTVRFYRDILGMPLVATIGRYEGDVRFRHYFFEIGPGHTLAFFEWPDAEIEEFNKPAGLPASGRIQFDHVSFNVADEAALLDLQRRLRAHGVEVTRVVDHRFLKSIYFTDPNGISLEASYWVKDPTGIAPDLNDRVLFADPNPVPAVVEASEREKAAV
jgi:catechol 2,3-dioxygenase-like lactoylglutathione lyase family enzyme